MATLVLTIVLLLICMLLLCIGLLVARKPFRPGHACRMDMDRKRSKRQNNNRKLSNHI